MTVVAILLLPVVLAYQIWTYYVFRQRVSKQEFQASPAPSAPASPPSPQPGSSAATPGATAAPAD
jgi:cytochrome bd ubiquinol oxidase subunit II